MILSLFTGTTPLHHQLPVPVAQKATLTLCRPCPASPGQAAASTTFNTGNSSLPNQEPTATFPSLQNYQKGERSCRLLSFPGVKQLLHLQLPKAGRWSLKALAPKTNFTQDPAPMRPEELLSCRLDCWAEKGEHLQDVQWKKIGITGVIKNSPVPSGERPTSHQLLYLESARAPTHTAPWAAAGKWSFNGTSNMGWLSFSYCIAKWW